MSKGKILIAEDNAITAEQIKKFLQNVGFKVDAIEPSASRALRQMENETPDLIIVGDRLKTKMNGIELVGTILNDYNIPVIYMSASADEAGLEIIEKTKPLGTITKPFEMKELLREINMTLYKQQIAKQLRESEQKYKLLTEKSLASITIFNRKGHFLFMNRYGSSWLGGKPEDYIGKKSLYDVFPKEDADKHVKRFNRIVDSGKGESIEEYDPQLKRWISSSLEPVELIGEEIGVQVIAYDITESRKNYEQIQRDLQEKEILLQELHHRVMNNLQIICSLLSLQAEHIRNKQTLDIFRESQNRVRSMALVHRELFQSTDFLSIDYNRYIENLVLQLYRVYDSAPGRIAYKLKVENVSININLVVPFGLVINELVSNALRHAFPPSFERKGRVKISLRRNEKDEIELIVNDNGVGIPKTIDIHYSDSLGMQLIVMLVKDQLNGKIKLDRRGGAKFTIIFKGELSHISKVIF